MVEQEFTLDEMLSTMRWHLSPTPFSRAHTAPLSLIDAESIAASCRKLAANGTDLADVSAYYAQALRAGSLPYRRNLMRLLFRYSATLHNPALPLRTLLAAGPDADDDGPLRAAPVDRFVARVFLCSVGIDPGHRPAQSATPDPVDLLEDAVRATYNLSGAGRVFCLSRPVSARAMRRSLAHDPLLFLRVLSRTVHAHAHATRHSIWRGLLAPGRDARPVADDVAEHFFVLVACDRATHADPAAVPSLHNASLPPGTVALWPSRVSAFCRLSRTVRADALRWFSAPVPPRILLLDRF